jgi:OmpA-OmpF porin, OOP family
MNATVRRGTIALLALLAPLLAQAQADAENCTDHPGISRMPNFHIYECSVKEFDAGEFAVGPQDKGEHQSQEGRYFRYHYEQKEGAPQASKLQIIRNYQNAAKRSGGVVVADWKGDNWAGTSLKLSQAGKETWVQVDARDGSYVLTIVEKGEMAQDVVMDAGAMGTALKETGKVALYGIYFDFGKSVVKPESTPALTEVSKLLKQVPTLTLFVVGHTDMVGDPASNMRLSQDRAAAVVAALTGQFKVPAARLRPMGCGPYAPVATNATEEGRAKNRRVELVDAAAR